MPSTYYYVASVIFLAALLFFPTSKLIWVLSVRRLQRKLNTDLSAEKIAGQRKRAYILALTLVILFSLLFNMHLLELPEHG